MVFPRLKHTFLRLKQAFLRLKHGVLETQTSISETKTSIIKKVYQLPPTRLNTSLVSSKERALVPSAPALSLSMSEIQPLKRKSPPNGGTMEYSYVSQYQDDIFNTPTTVRRRPPRPGGISGTPPRWGASPTGYSPSTPIARTQHEDSETRAWHSHDDSD